MTSPWRRLLRRTVPAHLGDPFGLALRLVKSRNSAAYFAMGSAALGLMITPLDWALKSAEKRRYRAAPARRGPTIFVCGPPRSGTTIVASTLLAHLPLAYFTNLTSLFPRSPLVASHLLGGLLKSRRISGRNYYGRSAHLSGPNDALYLWDRWLGDDRQTVPERLDAEARSSMGRFFDAWEHETRLPLLNKCNNLNASAHWVADALPDSHFVCLEREPLYLAQSLYRARVEIHGDPSMPYGLTDPDSPGCDDPLDDVCDQVRYHAELARLQQERIGAKRFWRVSYEEFCRDPGGLVDRVASEVLGLEHDPGAARPEPLRVSAARTIDEATFASLRAKLERRSGADA